MPPHRHPPPDPPPSSLVSPLFPDSPESICSTRLYSNCIHCLCCRARSKASCCGVARGGKAIPWRRHRVHTTPPSNAHQSACCGGEIVLNTFPGPMSVGPSKCSRSLAQVLCFPSVRYRHNDAWRPHIECWIRRWPSHLVLQSMRNERTRLRVSNDTECRLPPSLSSRLREGVKSLEYVTSS